VKHLVERLYVLICGCGLFRPEAMGLVCALVYLLAIVNFLPFAFKRDIVEVTSGAGSNKNRVLEAQEIETGRFLHRFPLEKVNLLPATRILLHSC